MQESGRFLHFLLSNASVIRYTERWLIPASIEGKKCLNMLIGDELLDHLMALGPYFKEIFGKDLVVWITDTDNILAYHPGEHFDVGSDGILAADDPMRIAMQKRQTIQGSISTSISGIPYKEIDNPIIDENGSVVGCISVGISLDQETKVVNVAHNITEAVDNMDSSIRGFTESAENIKKSENILRENINGVNSLTKEIGKVLSFTKRITDQTNLLGLNASIEAARAGQHGAGFGVVADEICKLSVESMSVAKKIEALLVQITDANSKTLECSDTACAATEEQALEIKKTKARISELKIISDQLMAISKEI